MLLSYRGCFSLFLPLSERENENILGWGLKTKSKVLLGSREWNEERKVADEGCVIDQIPIVGNWESILLGNLWNHVKHDSEWSYPKGKEAGVINPLWLVISSISWGMLLKALTPGNSGLSCVGVERTLSGGELPIAAAECGKDWKGEYWGTATELYFTMWTQQMRKLHASVHLWNLWQ